MTTGGVVAATGTLKNLKLIDVTSGVQYGGTIASLDSSSTGSTITPVAIFDNISNLRVPKSGSIVIKVVSDLSSQVDGGMSSSTHRLVINPDYVWHVTSTDGIAAVGGSSTRSVIATGADSGFSISTTSLDFNTSSANSNTDAVVASNYFDAFRTKITVAKSASSPSGTVSGGDDQIVAIFVVSNSANVGNYTATLQLMNLEIGSTISTHQSTARQVKVWRDSVGSGNDLVTTTNFPTGFTSTEFESNGGSFLDTDISADSSRTYYVTADTHDAAADKRLTVGIGLGDIKWSDGTTSNITIVDSLPVTGNTLSY